MRDVSGGSRSSGGLAALATAAAAFACALGGPALAQEPPIYDIPTPDADHPSGGTPFQNPPRPPPRRRAAGEASNPFPYVRTAGSYTDQRTSFSRVLVRAPKGARLDARCSARRCKHVRRTVTSSRARHLKTPAAELQAPHHDRDPHLEPDQGRQVRPHPDREGRAAAAP